MKHKDLESLNARLQIFITRSMIALALVDLSGMDERGSWAFSEDLDLSIEQDYLPIDDLMQRYEKILADCREYVEGEK
jgi:hypothetical protein